MSDYISEFSSSALSRWDGLAPWALVARTPAIVSQLLGELSADEYEIAADIAVHRTAVIEPGAVLKGPLIVGASCFVATGAYLRGGCWLGANCIVGPGAELKTSIVFSGSKLAHFNFVGDSILGTGVNLEAGSIVCNYRNERADKGIHVRIDGQLHPTGCDKFGALIGDQARIGANAVLAPGALIEPGFIVRRGQLLDGEA